jgi:hypothetical protein
MYDALVASVLVGLYERVADEVAAYLPTGTVLEVSSGPGVAVLFLVLLLGLLVPQLILITGRLAAKADRRFSPLSSLWFTTLAQRSFVLGSDCAAMGLPGGLATSEKHREQQQHGGDVPQNVHNDAHVDVPLPPNGVDHRQERDDPTHVCPGREEVVDGEENRVE